MSGLRVRKHVDLFLLLLLLCFQESDLFLDIGHLTFINPVTVADVVFGLVNLFLQFYQMVFDACLFLF